jgi:hypothetical protein
MLVTACEALLLISSPIFALSGCNAKGGIASIAVVIGVMSSTGAEA